MFRAKTPLLSSITNTPVGLHFGHIRHVQLGGRESPGGLFSWFHFGVQSFPKEKYNYNNEHNPYPFVWVDYLNLISCEIIMYSYYDFSTTAGRTIEIKVTPTAIPSQGGALGLALGIHSIQV